VNHGISSARLVDGHCHGFVLRDRLRLDPSRFEERLTYAGMLYDASASSEGPRVDEREMAGLGAMSGSSVFALAARRALSEFLGCDETPEAVAAARAVAAAEDPAAYLRRLLGDQRITALIADEGFPRVPRRVFQNEVGVPVYRAWRIESWFAERLGQRVAFDAFEEDFVASLREAAADPHTVAFKTVVAFPAGLRVAPLSRGQAASAYRRWMDAGQPLDGGEVAGVLHFLVRRTLDVAAETERPVHIHTGAGDPFMARIDNVHPQDLYPLLAEYRRQPIVLVHSGYPWLDEAAYIAATLPFVHLDISAWQPWATLDLERGLGLLLGAVPTAKILYGSDEASEPEILWLSARFFKAALGRVLDTAVAHQYLSAAQATDVAAGVLGANTTRLHSLPE